MCPTRPTSPLQVLPSILRYVYHITDMSSHATLGAASDDRKARLAKLRSLKRKQPEDDDAAQRLSTSEHTTEDADAKAVQHHIEAGDTAHEVGEDAIATKYLSGRNYDALTRGPKLGFEQSPAQQLEGPTLEEQAADVEEETLKQAAVDAQDKGIDLFKIQPKRPNWDLKRELDKKLEVLNVRTDNAIARLVRERLTGAKSAAAAANALGAGEDAALEGGEPGALKGAEIVEGIRLREREEAEEERRERELEDEA